MSNIPTPEEQAKMFDKVIEDRSYCDYSAYLFLRNNQWIITTALRDNNGEEEVELLEHIIQRREHLNDLAMRIMAGQKLT